MSRSRLALIVALAIDNVGSGLFLPLALVYATRVVGLDVETAGTVVAAATLLGFAVPPLAGRLTHRFGPRSVVASAQLVQCAGSLTYLVSRDAVGVFAAAGLMAVGTQLFYCSVFVLVADASTNEAKERPFALVAMVRSGAFGLGALMGAIALSGGSDDALRWLVAADASTFVVAAVLLIAFVAGDPTSTDTPAVGTGLVLRDRRYLALMVATCLVGLAVDFALIGMPVFLLEIADAPGWLPGALLATGAVLSSFYGVWVVDRLRRFRRTRALQAGAWLYVAWAVLSMAMLWLPRPALVPYAALTWCVMVVASKVFFPLSGALSEALPPRTERAGYMATYQYAFTTAQVLAPAVVALFAVATWLPWVVIAGSSAVGVAVLAWLGSVIPSDVDRRPVAGLA